MTSLKFSRIKALFVKEFYQIIRDSSSILIAFIFPLILLFIYGVGVSLDMNDLKGSYRPTSVTTPSLTTIFLTIGLSRCANEYIPDHIFNKYPGSFS